MIITSRLLDEANIRMINIHPLPFMVVMRRKRKKEYDEDELEYPRKFDEKLGRLTYGLCLRTKITRCRDVTKEDSASSNIPCKIYIEVKSRHRQERGYE